MNDIRELVFLLRNHRKARWNRVDPFGELFFDRMEKADVRYRFVIDMASLPAEAAA